MNTNPDASKFSRRFPGGFRASEIVLTALLLGSLTVTFFLSREVLRLRGVISHLKSEGRLAPGAEVPPLEGLDVDGQPIQVDYSESPQPTLLYVFSPDCGWCARNQESFKILVGAVKDSHRIVGVSTTPEGVKEYVEANGYEFPTVARLPRHTIDRYKLGGTPQTLLISSQGKVLKNWMGAYGEAVQADLEEYFGVELPEMEPPDGE